MKKIAVLGLGKVGTLAAELLNQSGSEVVGLDNATPSRQPCFYGQAGRCC